MDVTCERCGTEYEFDETLLSERGTTVKCTHCGHLFKVYRGGTASLASPAPPASAGDARPWLLRSAEGHTRELASLKALQRLITEGSASSDDEIARTGDAWKRLGDIAELQTFFAAARAAATAPTPGLAGGREPTVRGLPRPDEAPRGSERSSSQRPPPLGGLGKKGTMMGVGGPPGVGTAAEAASPSPPQREAPGDEAAQATRAAEPSQPRAAFAQTLAGIGEKPVQDGPARAAAPNEGAPSAKTPARRADGVPITRSPHEAASAADVEAATVRGLGAIRGGGAGAGRAGASDDVAVQQTASDRPPPPERAHAPGRPGRRPSQRPPSLRVDEDDAEPSVALPRRGPSGLWVGLLVVAAIGAGVALGWPRLAPLLGGGEDPAAAFLVEGDAALARDRDEAYDDAAQAFTKALALDPHDVRALVGLSRSHALLAQAHLFEAADLDLRATSDAAAGGEAAALRRQATTEAAEAREHAEAAVRVGSGGADAEVVLADALRLAGDALARSRIERARTIAPAPSAEALRVEALIAAEGDHLEAAIPLAEQAVSEDPGLLRARVLLARAHLAAGDVAAARRQVDAVLARDGEHPAARAFAARLDGASSATGDAAVAIDGGVSPAAPLPSAATSAPTVPADPGDSDAVPVSAGGRRDYESLVAEGDRRLENGDPRGARRLFEEALAARPGAAEAISGVGFALLEVGDVAGAAARFRTASDLGFGDALIGLGDAYRRLGDRDRALEAYERYLERFPSGSRVSIARAQATRLRAEGATSGGAASDRGGAARPTSGGSAPTAPEPAPAPPSEATEPEPLPAPRGAAEAPPNDTPALESAP